MEQDPQEAQVLLVVLDLLVSQGLLEEQVLQGPQVQQAALAELGQLESLGLLGLLAQQEEQAQQVIERERNGEGQRGSCK